MSVRNLTAFAAGALTVVVLGTGTAYAATGGDFKLGRANSAGRATTLTAPNSSALVLRSKAGLPSLRVNRAARVPNLNADLVDGVNSTSLARVVTVGTVIATGLVDDGDTPSDPSDDAIVAVATCPPGSQVMGGGAGDFTGAGVPYFSGPVDSRQWAVFSSADPHGGDYATDLTAYARCWNPRGNVGTVQQRTTPRRVSPGVRTMIDLARRP
jgi:hypothetical protein